MLFAEPNYIRKSCEEFRKIGPQDHTGDEIKLSATDTTGILTAKDKTGASVSLQSGMHFSVAGYASTVNKGTARVTLRGTGDFAGTKTVTFKIMPKKVEDLGALTGGEWKDAKQ